MERLIPNEANYQSVHHEIASSTQRDHPVGFFAKEQLGVPSIISNVTVRNSNSAVVKEEMHSSLEKDFHKIVEDSDISYFLRQLRTTTRFPEKV